MEVDDAPSFLLRLELISVGGHLVHTAAFMPNGTHPPSGAVVVRVNLCTDKASPAFLKFTFNALELRNVAAQFLLFF